MNSFRTVLRLDKFEDRNSPSTISTYNDPLDGNSPPVFPPPTYSEPQPATETGTTPLPTETDPPPPSPPPTSPPTPTPPPPVTSEPPMPEPPPNFVDGLLWFDFTSVVYDGSQTGPVTHPPVDDAEQINAGLADPVAAPVSKNLKMSEIADEMVKVYGTKEKANLEFDSRRQNVGENFHINDVDQLKGDALKDKLRYIQRSIATVDGKERVFTYLMWGQDISLTGYNGTVLQTIDIETKTWPKGEATPVKTNQVQLEAFYLKDGKTNMDMQTNRMDFETAKVDKVEVTWKLTLGAGTYKAPGGTEFKGVDKFTILEKKHKAPLNGEVKWAGGKTEITLKVTIDKAGAVTYGGPWGNQ